MRIPRTPGALVVVVVLVGLAACSASDTQGSAGFDSSDASTSAESIAAEAGADEIDTIEVVDETAGQPSVVTDAVPDDTSPPDTIPENGIPGLDSTDEFCRAWSRYGGSFQVVSVMASFAAETPEDAAAIEVVAAPVATAGYEAMFANWPDELAGEREVAADEFFGPFARRSSAAYDALLAAGATDAVLATMIAAWEDALATRDPAEPTVAVNLPDDIWAIIDLAAADLADRFVPIPSDPSLIIEADIPQTDAYLTATCPDQFTLAGGEIDGS